MSTILNTTSAASAFNKDADVYRCKKNWDKREAQTQLMGKIFLLANEFFNGKQPLPENSNPEKQAPKTFVPLEMRKNNNKENETKASDGRTPDPS